MLYAWLVDQIKRIAAEDRRTHVEQSGEHIDPLRWQVNFGLGAAGRLLVRLAEVKRQHEKEVNCQALVVSHAAEVSDYLEQRYGYRVDGQPTQRQREAEERYERQERELAELKARDIDEYYRQRPWERPLTPEQEAERDRRRRLEAKREERNERRRRQREEERGYYGRHRDRASNPEDERRDEQGYAARAAGRSGADRINLEPFLTGRTEAKPLKARKG